MLTDVITLNDGVANRAFTLVSRNGMDSIRRETTAGTSSSSLSALTIKNTIDEKSKTKPNRHLMAITFTEYDTAGLPQTHTVHAVVTRAKGSTDAAVIKSVEMLAAFLATEANMTQVLIGGN